MEHNASLNEYRDMLATKQRKNFFTTPKFIFAAGSIALLLIGFGSGVAYQKGKTTSTAQAASAMQDSRFGGMQGFGGGMRDTNRAFGTVSAISDSSITVTTRSNSSVTYTLSSSTTVTDDGNSASIGDIQTGDTVILTLDSSDSKAVTMVALNPSFGGPGGGATGTGTDDSSSAVTPTSTSSI